MFTFKNIESINFKANKMVAGYWSVNMNIENAEVKFIGENDKDKLLKPSRS
jgi:hypothetical protein